jgi:H+/Cl- antiporter ClcA
MWDSYFLALSEKSAPAHLCQHQFLSSQKQIVWNQFTWVPASLVITGHQMVYKRRCVLIFLVFIILLSSSLYTSKSCSFRIHQKFFRWWNLKYLFYFIFGEPTSIDSHAMCKKYLLSFLFHSFFPINCFFKLMFFFLIISVNMFLLNTFWHKGIGIQRQDFSQNSLKT